LVNALTELYKHEADFVAGVAKAWLSNPLLRVFLRLIPKDDIEVALRVCIEENARVKVRQILASKIIMFIIKRGVGSFHVNRTHLVEGLKYPLVRRGLANILKGIAIFGVRRPQVTAAPFLVVWDFTKACNLKCKHCYESAGHPLKDELTTIQAKIAIDHFKDEGVVAIAFSGGEPLMRRDFFEIADYAYKKDFYVSLATNGTLITPSVAKKIKEAGVSYVEVSLDGFEREHDQLRGVRGAWKKACDGIRNCVSVGLDTCIAITATRYNVKNLPDFLEFVERELHPSRVIVFNFVPTGRARDMINADLEPQQREELLEMLYSKMVSKNCPIDFFSTAPQYSVVSLRFANGPAVSTHFTNKVAIEAFRGRTKVLSEFIGGCGAGRLYCGLEPNGDVTPCVFMPIRIGNIRKNRLGEIWRSSRILRLIRDRDLFKGCGDCDYKYVCGGCRARAYGYFGDVQGPDPGCTFNLGYWEALRKIKTSFNPH
jgi:radical SAM protein with 4Fe4S-binding SPASM domain